MLLIPRFTIRLMLGLTAGCALFFAVVSMAVRGAVWAIALSGAAVSVMAAFLVYMAMFAAAQSISSLVMKLRGAPQPKSPFVTSAPPEQLLPPSTPD